MNLKIRIKLKKMKRKISEKCDDIMYKIFSPLSNMSVQRRETKDSKIEAYCKAMSDEELMRRFAKYIINYMLEYSKKERKYEVCNKRINGNGFSDFENDFIISELSNLSCIADCKDKYLSAFYYATKRYSIWDDDFIEKENYLNSILKSELEKLGVSVYYVDNRETYDEWWVKRVKYEKSLVVKLDL